MTNSAPDDQRRFRLTIAYDGRGYAGWQSQPGGDTIQDLLLVALRSICPQITTVQGSGRTDAGVCAEGQVAHFDVAKGWRMGGLEWQRALNTKLPPTIRVMECAEARPDFHARFSAGGKMYRYQIATGEVLSPLQVGLVWHQRELGTVDKLQNALSEYCGEHDFVSFAANRNDGFDAQRDTVRTIESATVARAADDLLEIHFRGNGFLYKMVRFLVGTAVYYSKDKFTRQEIRNLLTGVDREKKAPFCAPAQGLSLIEVHYPSDS